MSLQGTIVPDRLRSELCPRRVDRVIYFYRSWNRSFPSDSLIYIEKIVLQKLTFGWCILAAKRLSLGKRRKRTLFWKFENSLTSYDCNTLCISITQRAYGYCVGLILFWIYPKYVKHNKLYVQDLQMFSCGQLWEAIMIW